MPAPWRRSFPDIARFAHYAFQSQARCQPRGDQRNVEHTARTTRRFNLKRDASPVATWGCGLIVSPTMAGFNLKRDASPVATLKARSEARNYDEFQSQARCQPRGDLV